jgi:signal transduction histidine kinase
LVFFGCGIEKEILSKIFDPLFTTKDMQRGTGVGLYISKTIVEQEFEGTVEVESEIGSGSIFTVRFPIRKKTNEKNN